MAAGIKSVFVARSDTASASLVRCAGLWRISSGRVLGQTRVCRFPLSLQHKIEGPCNLSTATPRLVAPPQAAGSPSSWDRAELCTAGTQKSGRAPQRCRCRRRTTPSDQPDAGRILLPVRYEKNHDRLDSSFSFVRGPIVAGLVALLNGERLVPRRASGPPVSDTGGVWGGHPTSATAATPVSFNQEGPGVYPVCPVLH